MSIFSRQPWLNSSVSDVVFILSPPFLSLLIVILLPQQFKISDDMPAVYWMILVVFIDVAHVYSTLYRTYFNPLGMEAAPALLAVIPLCCYIIGVLLYEIDGMVFWRVLAYLAVFHFIRQQYGFMRLYSRNEQYGKLNRMIDSTAIYAATVFPVLYWHFGAARNFSWFINGDFFYFPLQDLISVLPWCYAFILICYFIKELQLVFKTKNLNIPRNMIIAGTFLSWYFGIVYFNGDMAFTTLNVISHGIPYVALIWFFEKRKYKSSLPKDRLLSMTFGRYGLVLFLVVIVMLAYFEEGLWDGLVWKEHANLFVLFKGLPLIHDKDFLALLVPLLALPQSTHYVLDGFIWKRK